MDEITADQPIKAKRKYTKSAAVPKKAAPIKVTIEKRREGSEEMIEHLPIEAVIFLPTGGEIHGFGETDAIALFNAAKQWMIKTDGRH